MGHWARAWAQWPMTWALCRMALSYVLWPCPMSYGPVLCPMALAIFGIQEGSLNPDILIEPNSWLCADTGCVLSLIHI